VQLPSYCRPDYQYNVMNVEDVQLVNGISWKETTDHSKWAITMTNNYTCIGDINRVSGQLKRGGGTVRLIKILTKIYNRYVLIKFLVYGMPFPVL
jgi:hypothetical protein